MSGWEIAAGFALGLVANEMCDVSPWLARHVVSVAARLWTPNAELRKTYAEEWRAIIAERPGKLFKLFTGLGFLGAGAWRFARFRTAYGLSRAAKAVEPKGKAIGVTVNVIDVVDADQDFSAGHMAFIGEIARQFELTLGQENVDRDVATYRALMRELITQRQQWVREARTRSHDKQH